MGATGYRERIELDRAETTEDLEHRGRPSLERTRGSERVARDEKATCGLSGDPHTENASRWRAGPRGGPWLVDVQLVEERKRVVESLEQVLVVLDHLAAHVDAKPLLVRVQLIAIEHVSEW